MSSIRRFKFRQAQRRRRLQPGAPFTAEKLARAITHAKESSDELQAEDERGESRRYGSYTVEQLQAGDEATVADMATEQADRLVMGVDPAGAPDETATFEQKP